MQRFHRSTKCGSGRQRRMNDARISYSPFRRVTKNVKSVMDASLWAMFISKDCDTFEKAEHSLLKSPILFRPYYMRSTDFADKPHSSSSLTKASVCTSGKLRGPANGGCPPIGFRDNL